MRSKCLIEHAAAVEFIRAIACARHRGIARAERVPPPGARSAHPARLVTFALASAIALAACVSNETGRDAGLDGAHDNADAPDTASPDARADQAIGSDDASTDAEGGSPAVYDTSVGVAVDPDGYASLPLRVGAHRYFVSSATGSDANGCSGAQQPSTPLATIAAAKACIPVGGNEGDQILIAQDTRYAEGLSNMMDQMGYSAQYPTVIESYDPADPLNEALYGRAANGHRPVINTGGNYQGITCYCGNTPNVSNNFIAIRGLDFNPGDQPGMDVGFIGPSSYVLIENNVFRYTSLTFDNGGPSVPRSAHLVVRMNSFYGEWHATAHAQGIFDSGTDGVTVEDNVFWHNGWRLGVTRDEPVATGGPTIFRHPVYAQNTSTAIIYRRNLVIEAAADGGHLLGDTAVTDNVIIDCPIAVDISGGVSYDTVRPDGVDYQVSGNAIMGAEDLTSSDPRGFGITSRNGAPGSSAHHNLLVHATNASGGNRIPFDTTAGFGKPSYMDYHDNVSYLRARSGGSTFEANDGATGSVVHASYTNNVWDDPASGTNRNVGSASFPHPYTAAELYTALGFADRQAFIDDAIEHPEAHPARRARALLFAGYGMN
jgi:hypothetical protein